MKHANKKLLMQAYLLSVVFAMGGTQNVFAFESGSDGSDGALDFSWVVGRSATAVKAVFFDPTNPETFDPANPDRRLDADGDNVFHFTTINIPTGVNVVLRADKLNWAPVYWLAQSNITIESWAYLSLNGQAGHTYVTQANSHFSTMPGPGGFAGGIGASGLNRAQPGFGPGAGLPSLSDADGGGASHAGRGAAGDGTAGDLYGSPFLLPLIGGSGGAGGGDSDTNQATSRGGGGAGGGAIVIASSTRILMDGGIGATGGAGNGARYLTGGGGSGGAVRLLAPEISGRAYYRPNSSYGYTGFIDVRGGAAGYSGGNAGGSGRIRIEASINSLVGTLFPDAKYSVRMAGLIDTTPFLPTDLRIPKWPKVWVSSINGQLLPDKPTASFEIADASINTIDPVAVVFIANHIPTDAIINLKLVSSDYGVIDVQPTFTTGAQSSSTWSANVAFPSGFSRGYVQATWTTPAL